MWREWFYDIKAVPVRWERREKEGIRKGDERRGTEIQTDEDASGSVRDRSLMSWSGVMSKILV